VSQPFPPAAVDGGLPVPLSPVDYAWLRMDDPTNLMMINGILAFEGTLPREALRQRVEKRLLPIPRFRQRVVLQDRRGLPLWQDDPDFDLDAHLYETTLPAPGEDPQLRAVVCQLMSQPLDRDRPLWSFHLIHGYQGGSALMGRLHHCIGDGMALMLVLLSLTDSAPEAVAALRQTLGDEEPDAIHPNPFLNLFTRARVDIETIRRRAEEMMPEGMNLLLKPVEALQRTSRLVAGVASAGALSRMTLRLPDPKTAFKGPLGVAKRAAWSRLVPMAEIQALREGFPGTVNDVLMTAMTGGLRRYLLGRGEEPAESLRFRAAVPVNLRGLAEMAALGNQFGLVFLSLPVGITDPAERLAELQRRMGVLKRSAEPLVVYYLLKLIGQAPRAIQQAVVTLFAQKTTAVMTNVPGPRKTLYLADRRVRSIFFWVPQAGRVGLGISIFSYDGHVRLGVATDAGLVPDPEIIIGGFHDELNHMLGRS